MVKIKQKNSRELIPLRLIITNRCNGMCDFCHHEGIKNKKLMTMSMQLFENCVVAAKQVGIKKIVISGGEPTLDQYFHERVSKVRELYPESNLSVTTNGFGMEKLTENLHFLDKVNISISSFDSRIFEKYQKVNPKQLFDHLKGRNNISINLVITNENKHESVQIVQAAIDNNFSISIMFELRTYNKIELESHLELINAFEKAYGPAVYYEGNVPYLKITVNRYSIIEIRHPYYNYSHFWDFCARCKEKTVCFERLCAVRIDPRGTVYPCLNRHIIMTNQDRDITTAIEQIYNEIGYSPDSISKKSLAFNEIVCLDEKALIYE